MSRHLYVSPGPRRRRRFVTVLTTMFVVMFGAVSAFAYFTATGFGTGTATAGTLNAPTNVVATSTPASLSATITWNASAGNVTPHGYYVTRTDSSDHTAAACSTSPSALTPTTMCTDSSLALDTYTYVVTAVFNTWDAPSVPSAPVTVAKGDQAITFQSSPPANAVVDGPTYTVGATGGASTNPVVISIDAVSTSPTVVCTLGAGNVVTFNHPGLCRIDANQAGNANYNAAPQASQDVTVGKGSQAINFTSSPGSPQVAGPTYTVTASGGASHNAVTFTIDATASGVCSIASAVVSFQHVGSCVIDANQLGNGDYLAAPQNQQTFTVGQGTQTITFTTTKPSAAAVGGTTYTPAANGGASGNPVVFTIDAATTNAACSIASGVVSFQHVGTCVVDANQAAGTDYSAAPQQQQSFTVGQGAQSISFSSTASAPTFGGTYAVSANGGNSGQPVVFTSETPSVCTTSGTNGSTVSFAASGSCTIDANQAGTADYLAASQVQQTFSVAKANQTVSITSPAPSTATYKGPTYSVVASATSTLAVTITSLTPTICIAGGTNGATISFTGTATGSCTIAADQAGDSNHWNAAGQVTQTFNVAKADQTVTFTSTTPSTAVYHGTYSATATASSGLAITFTTTDATICTVTPTDSNSATINFVDVGSCTVNADQAGNGVYNVATPTASQTFPISRASQTVGFTSGAPSGATNGGATYSATATASSTLLASISSATPSICTGSGTSPVTITFVGVGTCTLNANQGGDSHYLAAPQAQQSFSVTAAVAAKLVITTGAVSGAASNSATLGPITVQQQDASGNPVVESGGARTITLGSTGSAVFAASSGGTSTTTVSIPNGASSVNFFYGNTVAGSPVITAASTAPTTITSAQQTETITAGTANKLGFATAPVSGTASSSATLGPVTVQIQDSFGNPVNQSGGTRTITLSSTGSEKFAATSGGSAITSVTIANGSNSASFFYGDTLAGSPVITAATTVPNSLASGTQTETIVGGAPTALGFANCSINGATAGACAASIAVGNGGHVDMNVSLHDQFGNLATTTAGQTWTIGLSSDNPLFTLSTTSLTIAGPANLSSATFRVTYTSNGTASATITAHRTAGNTSPADGTITVKK